MEKNQNSLIEIITKIAGIIKSKENNDNKVNNDNLVISGNNSEQKPNESKKSGLGATNNNKGSSALVDFMTKHDMATNRIKKE